MNAPLESPKRRIAIAKRKIKHLEGRLKKFFNKKPYRQVVEHDPNTGDDLHKVKLTTPIPELITELAYEATDALRSSLDQATCSIATACGVEKLNQIYFPVADTASDFVGSLKTKIKGFPPDFVTLFQSFKTYKGENDLIWALNRIRRESYHRLIVPVGVASNGMLIKAMKLSGQGSIPSPRWDEEKNEMVFAKTGPNTKFSYDLQLSFYIAFGEIEGIKGLPVPDTLSAITKEVERIVHAIEAEGKRTGIIA